MADPVTLGPFLGINNRLPDHKLGTEDGAYLRNAINVDLTDAGTLQRRGGYARKILGTACHSLFEAADGRALFVDYDALFLAGPGEEGALSAVALLTGLTPGAPMSYAQVGDSVFISNGVEFWRIQGGAVLPHAVEPPQWVPMLEAAAGGSLPAGRYQVVVTYRLDDGQETAPAERVQVTLTADGAVVVGGLPQAFPAGVAAAVLYMTACNGDAFYRVASVGPGAAPVSVPVLPDGGALCPTLNLRPLPPGRIVRAHMGRLLSASGPALFYSRPFASALFDPVRDYVLFPAPVTVVEPVPGGCYVCADKTYWLAGDVEQAALVEVLPYGAAFGSGTRLRSRPGAAWWSDRGLVVAGPGGEVQAVQDRAVAVTPAQAAAVLIREQGGINQAVAAAQGGGSGASVAAARSFIDAEVVRKEDR